MNNMKIKIKMEPLSKSTVESDKKESALIDILEMLSNENCDLSKVSKDLQELYKDDYRHSYSDIFNYLKGSYDKNNQQTLGKLETLQINISCLEEELKKYKEETIINKYFKLKDHVMLEISRIIFWHTHNSKLVANLEDVNNNISIMKRDAKQLKKGIKESRSELEGFRTTQITVITMFISIVLVVVTDIRFSVSVLELASEMPIMNVILLLTVGSFTMLNIGVLFFRIIFNLLGKAFDLKDSYYWCVNIAFILIMLICLICSNIGDIMYTTKIINYLW